MKWAGVVVTLLAMASACGDRDGQERITVFAASSLTEAFEEIRSDFEETRAGVDVTYSFAGSQELRAQLVQGAPADVFAAANSVQMTMAQDEGAVSEEARIFARNRLIVILSDENPANIETLQDLADDGVRIVIAGEEVPVGQYTLSFLAKASQDEAFAAGYREQVLANVVSQEANVRQVAVKVQLGEADAGIVYSTDVTAFAADIAIIPIPDELNELAEYSIALTTEPGSEDVAGAFIDYVLSEAGQDVLAEHGFIRVDR